MIRRRISWAVLLGLLSICLMGCAGKKHKLSLREAVGEFNDAVRWRRHLTASKFLMPMDRASFVKEQDKAEDDRRIMDYEIRGIARLDGENAVVRVRVEFTRVSSPIVYREHHRQTWTRVSGDWFVLRLEKEEPDKNEGK